MAAKLIMVKYGNLHYRRVEPKLEEIPGHFDVKKINPTMEYSLHTEYSYDKREFSSPVFDKLRKLKDSSYEGLPLLWYDRDWSEQFFQFITYLVGKRAPKIIEIHPPFRNYCSNVGEFLEIYSVFEELINEEYPDTTIAIENRTTTHSRYKGRFQFLVSDDLDIKELLQEVREKGFKLKLMLDIPQLFSAMGGVRRLNMAKLTSTFQMFEEYRDLIIGIHIYGNAGRAHLGDLDSLFKSSLFKEEFLRFLSEYFDDNIPRYLIPEVNSKQEDFESIVNDLLKYFEFVA